MIGHMLILNEVVPKYFFVYLMKVMRPMKFCIYVQALIVCGTVEIFVLFLDLIWSVLLYT